MSRIKGAFMINGVRIPNIIVDEGEDAFLRMLVHDDQSDVPAAGNYYIGLTTDIGVGTDTTLATLSGELPAVNGYARQPVSRDVIGWPTVQAITGYTRASSKIVTFSAIGGDFSAAYTRAFLCNVAAGTIGTLFSISGKLEESVLVTEGLSVDVQYDLFLGYQ